MISPPARNQDGFNSFPCPKPTFSLVRSRLRAESERCRDGFVFHGDIPVATPLKELGEVGGGGEVEPLELKLERELQLADRLLEQLIERASEVDRT